VGASLFGSGILLVIGMASLAAAADGDI